MPVSERFSQNIAAVFLGTLLLGIVAAVVVLELDGAGTPDVLEILAGVAGGALAALVTNQNRK